MAQNRGKLALKPDKLWASFHMLSASVFFVLNEMRKSSATHGLSSTGEGLEWGVLCGFGPGLTVETLILQCVHLIVMYSAVISPRRTA